MYETLLVLSVNTTQNTVCNCVVSGNKTDPSHKIGLVPFLFLIDNCFSERYCFMFSDTL